MNETTDAADECVSLSRAAKILGVCVRTVRREIAFACGWAAYKERGPEARR
jgi:hypothetical protein